MRGEQIAYSEQLEKEPVSVHGLEPYEIKQIDGVFVACLPIAGTKNTKGESAATVYGEISFTSEEEAFQAVAEARKDLGIAGLN